jgi:hypothetical protein
MILWLFPLLALGSDTPRGWSRAERYSALRFSCPGRYDARAYAISLRDLADGLFAFGWVQVSRNGTGPVVGEFRGTFAAAPAFEAALAAGAPGANLPCDTRRYPNTLLSLHFADFKLLSDERETCFDSPPHACEGAPAETPAAAAPPAAPAAQEL